MGMRSSTYEFFAVTSIKEFDHRKASVALLIPTFLPLLVPGMKHYRPLAGEKRGFQRHFPSEAIFLIPRTTARMLRGTARGFASARI